MATTIARWGTGAGIHVPVDVMTRAKLRIGDAVSFDVQEDGVKLVPVQLTKSERLEARFKGYSGDTRCHEIDWGADVGKEVIE